MNVSPSRNVYCQQCKGFMGYHTTNPQDLKCKKCGSELGFLASEVVFDEKGVQCVAYDVHGTKRIKVNVN